jgi:inward rectifier potassium channel
LLTALFTGLVFAKFSLPVGRFVFSRQAVVTTHEGQRVLMFRVGNERGNRVVEAQIKVDAAITTLAEGRTFYRQVELPLCRARIAALSRTWNVIHVLDGSSPLAGLDPEKAEQMELELVVTVLGLDDTTGQTLHGQHLYEARAIRYGMRFADVLTALPNGDLVLDVRRFHDIEPDSEAAGPIPAPG